MTHTDFETLRYVKGCRVPRRLTRRDEALADIQRRLPLHDLRIAAI